MTDCRPVAPAWIKHEPCLGDIDYTWKNHTTADAGRCFQTASKPPQPSQTADASQGDWWGWQGTRGDRRRASLPDHLVGREWREGEERSKVVGAAIIGAAIGAFATWMMSKKSDP